MQDTGTFSEPLSVHILVSRRRQRTGRACSSLVHGRTYRIRVLCFAFTGHTAFSGCHKDEDECAELRYAHGDDRGRDTVSHNSVCASSPLQRHRPTLPDVAFRYSIDRRR